MSNKTIDNLQSLTNQYNSVLTQYQTVYQQYSESLKQTLNANAQGGFEMSPQSQQYQQQLIDLNAQLIDINNQIIVIINSNTGTYDTDVKDNIKSHKVLKKNYGLLLDERKEIDNVLNHYETLQQEIDNTDIYTTESYTRYIVLLGVTIVLFFLLFKYAILSNQQSGGGEGNSKIKSDIIFLLCVMIVFLGLANIFKNVNLLIFLTVIIIIYIFIKIKLAKND
jgi:hypothetical protein